jgi:NhaP-type Na+/H+ or K+/H+ antiporter
MGAQWVAWRFRIPAIILLLGAGLTLGPFTGVLDPGKSLGAALQPMISAAVAVILFEGGLSLDIRGLRDASQGVVRIVLLVAPMVWGMITVAAHWVGNLSWPSAAVAGGVLVVTGPTVVQPLLRNARIETRAAAVLRWEAIVNDPVGALFAVVAFEAFTQSRTGAAPWMVGSRLLSYTVLAGAFGYLVARGIARAYRTTSVPEYLKVPLLFALVIGCLVGGNALLDEGGLLSVTVMGVTLANSRIASLEELRRFKEHAAVLLVSGVFVILTANIDPRLLAQLDWHSAGFAGLLIFAIRPVAVLLGTVGTNLSWRERLLISWIAPRGVVAVATSAVFGAALVANGVGDGARVPAVIFVIVLLTVILFGLTTVPMARWLKLTLSSAPGVLIVGSNAWTLSFAQALASMQIPVMIADRSWRALKPARDAAVGTYYGEILAEAAEHRLDHARFGQMIAATDSHSYNTLVCTDLGPSFGRQHVFQVGRVEGGEQDPNDIAASLGGRTLMPAGYDLETLEALIAKGWTFRKTKISDEFGFEAYSASLPTDSQVILAAKPSGEVMFATVNNGIRPASNDTVLAFVNAT